MLLITFDPDNRLVAGELEARWNAALSTVGEVQQRLRNNELPGPRVEHEQLAPQAAYNATGRPTRQI